MAPPPFKICRTTSATDSGLPSPPKKARFAPPEPPKASTSTAAAVETGRRSLHPHSQIWKWTFTPDALAPCRVADVFGMEDCDGTKDGKDPDFYWLGRVPCRSVLLYGIIVGVQQYEQRTVYSLDDGTGQVECNLRHSTPPMGAFPSPTKPKPSGSSKAPASPRKGRALGFVMNRFGNGLSQPPKPIAAVGDIVRVTGHVLNRHRTRLINTDEIAVCKNPTEEPLHWLAVAELHRSWYHPPNPELFVIPKPTVQPTPAPPPKSADSAQDTVSRLPPPDPSSPTQSSIASSAPSTPSSAATASDRGPLSPARLRHPSRLHTRDLTANTFRIYLKHYMDNAPQEKPRQRAVSSHPEDSSDDEEDFGRLKAWLANEPETPTKKRNLAKTSEEMTPRPPKPHDTVDDTPRAITAEINDRLGFTLSHLRRVPEIMLLARRVVDAEIKRRAKEDRRKQKEQATQPSQHSGRAPSASAYKPGSAILKSTAPSASAKPGEPKSAKMKRLFRYAIRQLYEEGSIVLWDGPVRPLPLRPLPSLSFLSAASRSRDAVGTKGLWKASSSTHAGQPPASGVSSVSQHGVEEDEDEDGELSDPPEGEDAYVPLSPGYLCELVEGAIKDIMSRPAPRQTNGWKSTGPRAGPSPDDITSYLHRRDERWARVGIWAVKDALEWGKSEGRVWCIGDNKWEVCG